MLVYSDLTPFPCQGCSHSGLCKYEESVMSFCRSNSATSTIDCLTVEYRCKYQQKTYTTSLRANPDICNTATGKAYTIATGSECNA